MSLDQLNSSGLISLGPTRTLLTPVTSRTANVLTPVG
jgi:hypothetical protein